MIIEAKNIFYISNFNSIGGVETYIYELARKYQDYDITVIYKTGDATQIKRLKQYVRVIKYQDQKIKCKKAFFNYETDIIDNIEADEYIQLIHAMFKTQKITYRINPKITTYFCVSQSAGDEWEELTGIKPILVKNPLEISEEEKKPVLYLISATRLTAEKGKSRIKKLARKFDEAGINYLWLIFTNDTQAINNPNILYLKPRLDIRPVLSGIKNIGYGVQLSDCEGDCYFTRECEALGVPLLVTPVPSFVEQGLVDGENCYYIPFDVENVDVKKIAENIPKYKPFKTEDNWKKVLVKGKSAYKENLKKIVKVQCIVPFYFDNQLWRNVYKNETFEVNRIRADELIEAKVCEEVN